MSKWKDSFSFLASSKAILYSICDFFSFNVFKKNVLYLNGKEGRVVVSSPEGEVLADGDGFILREELDIHRLPVGLEAALKTP